LASGRIVLDRLDRATLPALIERFRARAYHVLHFIGHGAFDRARGEGSLLLEDLTGGTQRVSSQMLSRALGGQPDLRLAVLNACEGACSTEADCFAGVAQRLVLRGVPAVIGMGSVVTDRGAIAFAKLFYTALAEGFPVDGALAQARLALSAEKPGIEWGTPVLYMSSPDGRLFALNTTWTFPPWTKTRASIGLLALLAVGAVLWHQRQTNPVPRTGEVSVSRTRIATDPRCPSPTPIDLAFRYIEPGVLRQGEEAEDPVREVEITRPFCIGVYEVTQAQWEAVMGSAENQSAHRDTKDLPVEKVSYEMALEFLGRLDDRDPGGHYRLPTDVEWDYAARAGRQTRYSFGDDAGKLHFYGNCLGRGHGDGFDRTAPIGSFGPNPWGLYDMHGNVWEWVESPDAGKMRVKRGGSWKSSAKDCRSSARQESATESRAYDTGLRVVREPLRR
jgi:hypothetical protein